MDYFNSTSPNCVRANIGDYVFNLTASYTDQSNEATMVATSVVMFVLASLFFNLNLFSRLSDVSAILNPSVRLFLSTSLSLFLPVMSYLFSEAKNGGAGQSADASQSELPLRARLILTWMLLVELLRKKVEAILITAGMQGYSGTIDRAARIAWLGYLVFFNLKSSGRKSVFGILWVITAAKLVQRVTFAEVAKRSFAVGKNAPLISSYMTQMLEEERSTTMARDEDVSAVMKSCKYAVMGEDRLPRVAGPHGYYLELHKRDEVVVTVGKVWEVAEAERNTDPLFASDPGLKRLSVSFALFKLLRQRFEQLPMTEAETRNSRDLIFRGLCRDGDHAAIVLFRVINDELNFLSEYYHSVLPVVFASPFFFLVNYLLFPIVVWGLCLMTVVLCGHGDLPFAFASIQKDNYALSVGLIDMIKCLLKQVLKSASAFFSTLDLSITFLLFLAFIYEQVWEFIVFVLSNWFMVSLLCDYTRKPQWRKKPAIRWGISGILWIRNQMSHPKMRFKQFSTLSFCHLAIVLPSVPVPKEVKRAIMESLLAYDGNTGPLSNGKSVLARYPQYSDQLSWACNSDSVTEVILIWHVATSLLEMKHKPQKKGASSSDREVATTLSKYCAYLVAFAPELLPDDQTGTERVYKEVKQELQKEMGWKDYFSAQSRYEKVMRTAGGLESETVAQKCVKLAKKMMDEAATDELQVWKLLAKLWTELIIYMAPATDRAHVQGHEQALAQGGEFITVLWALVTHTGITRPAATTSPAGSEH